MLLKLSSSVLGPFLPSRLLAEASVGLPGPYPHPCTASLPSPVSPEPSPSLQLRDLSNANLVLAPASTHLLQLSAQPSGLGAPRAEQIWFPGVPRPLTLRKGVRERTIE